MGMNSLKAAIFTGLFASVAIGCAHVNYVGTSSRPTSVVDIYFTQDEIEREYKVMGYALGSGTLFVSNERIIGKLAGEAREKGADAVLITGLGKSHVTAGDSSVSEKQIKASFLKYK